MLSNLQKFETLILSRIIVKLIEQFSEIELILQLFMIFTSNFLREPCYTINYGRCR